MSVLAEMLMFHVMSLAEDGWGSSFTLTVAAEVCF
jgi:hypothetical protein